jgi:competence protein ComEC
MGVLGTWLEAERGRFALWLPVAMIGGIVLYFSLRFEPPLWAGLGATALASLGLLLCWSHLPLRFGFALLLCAALGFARAEVKAALEPAMIKVPYGAVTVAGQVESAEQITGGVRVSVFPVSLDGAPVARAIRIRLRKTDQAVVVPGEQVSLRSLLFKPDRPAYPGGWDAARDAFFSGLGASGFAIGDVVVTAPARNNGSPLDLVALREAIAARILQVLPVDTGSIAVTLLTGFERQIPVAERQDFITAGLAHLLAVAGLHVGIVMGLFFAASRFLLTRFERPALYLHTKAIASIIAWIAGAAYAALTGAHLPILRSLAMASLVTLAVITGRRAISFRALALAAIAFMVMTPEAVVGVSFQMSFSELLALIAGYAAIRPRLFHREHLPALLRPALPIAALFYTSLLAGGASMPFAAYQFQQIQPYWILANLIAVPLTAFWVLPLGLVSLVLMPLHLAALALVPMGWGLAIIVWLTRIIAAWPGSLLPVAPMSSAAILCIAFGLAWLCLWRSRLRLAGLAVMLLGAGIYSLSRPPDVLVSPDARLIALSSPQGVMLLREPRASSFTLAQWYPVWPNAPFTPIDPSQCQNDICRPPTRYGNVIIALSPPASGCPPALLVISPVPLRGACPGVVIDRFTVWREGAVAAWVTSGHVTLQTDRQVQGTRPWIRPWPHPYGRNSYQDHNSRLTIR